MKLILLIFSAIHCFLVTDVQGINGGQLATVGQFKYLVSIEINHGLLNHGLCTGAIIHPRFIMTAAHCFTKKDKKNPNGQVFSKAKVTVFANVIGMEKRHRKTTCAIKRRGVRAHFVPQYFVDGFDDFALLELDRDLMLSGGLLEKLKLPEPLDGGDDGYDIDDITDAVLAGYGSTDIGQYDDYDLKWIDMKEVHYGECLNYYGDIDIDYRRKMCAQADEAPKTSCPGDSGAPLVVHLNDAWKTKKVVGVVDSGGDCREYANHPGIFARVTNYLHFIHKVMDETSNYPVEIETHDFKKKRCQRR